MGYLDDMRQRASQGFAPGWQPSLGDELLGVVEDVDHMTASKFGEYDVITLRRILGDRVTDERIAIHAFHTSLRTSMARKWPHPGGVLYVRFDGTKHNERTDQDFEAYDYLYDANPPEHLRLRGYENGGSRAPAPAAAPSRPSQDRNFDEEPF